MTLKSWFLLIILSFLWGCSFLFVEIALTDLNPFQLVFFRLLISTICLLILVLILKLKFPRNISYYLIILIASIFANALPFTLLTIAQQDINAGLTSILNSTTAFFTVIISSIFIATEKLKTHKLIGVLIGITGIVITIGYNKILEFDINNTAQLLIIFSSLSYAVAFVFLKKYSKQGINHIVNALFLMFFATIFSALIGIYFDSFNSIKFTLKSMANVALLAIFSTSLAYIIYFKLIKEAGSSNTSLATILVPIFALILDIIIINRFPQINEIIGFIIAIIGLLIMDNIHKRKLLK